MREKKVSLKKNQKIKQRDNLRRKLILLKQKLSHLGGGECKGKKRFQILILHRFCKAMLE
jgi:hypothetical protein